MLKLYERGDWARAYDVAVDKGYNDLAGMMYGMAEKDREYVEIKILIDKNEPEQFADLISNVYPEVAKVLKPYERGDWARAYNAAVDKGYNDLARMMHGMAKEDREAGAENGWFFDGVEVSLGINTWSGRLLGLGIIRDKVGIGMDLGYGVSGSSGEVVIVFPISVGYYPLPFFLRTAIGLYVSSSDEGPSFGFHAPAFDIGKYLTGSSGDYSWPIYLELAFAPEIQLTSITVGIGFSGASEKPETIELKSIP
ncbi:MAG: hypothetical protein DRP50_07380 [Thermotoga sp.]|nr:MAG: hypothetical protein DRP50_07380 [Thermotoga sp.]